MQAPAQLTFPALIQAHLSNHQTESLDWPSDAEFALVTRYSTWPIGWSDLKHVDFFTCREDFDKKVAELHAWARLEDNYVAYQGYEWDLGPNRMDDVSWCEGNL